MKENLAPLVTKSDTSCCLKLRKNCCVNQIFLKFNKFSSDHFTLTLLSDLRGVPCTFRGRAGSEPREAIGDWQYEMRAEYIRRRFRRAVTATLITLAAMITAVGVGVGVVVVVGLGPEKNETMTVAKPGMNGKSDSSICDTLRTPVKPPFPTVDPPFIIRNMTGVQWRIEKRCNETAEERGVLSLGGHPCLYIARMCPSRHSCQDAYLVSESV